MTGSSARTQFFILESPIQIQRHVSNEMHKEWEYSSLKNILFEKVLMA